MRELSQAVCLLRTDESRASCDDVAGIVTIEYLREGGLSRDGPPSLHARVLPEGERVVLSLVSVNSSGIWAPSKLAIS